MRSIETVGAAGAKRQRIGITFALETLGADLREAFDVVDHRDKGADAGEQRGNVEGAGWCVGGALLHPEAHLRDLAGAGADGHVEGGFVVDDQRLDVEARLRVVFEEEEALRSEHLRGHQGDAVPGRADALLHRIGREERAQDDPEQLHDLQNTSGFCPADLRELYPTKFVAWCLKSRRKIFRSPTDSGRLFDTKRASSTVSSRASVLRQAQDEARPGIHFSGVEVEEWFPDSAARFRDDKSLVLGSSAGQSEPRGLRRALGLRP
jgi:hypothetical protein